MFQQRGDATATLIIYAVVVFALVVTGGYISYRWMQAEIIKTQHERDNAIATAKTFEKVANESKRDADAADALAKERAVQLRKARDASAAYKAKIDTLLAAKPDVKQWWDSPVPDDVRRVRRIDAGCSPDFTVPCAEGKFDSDANAANAGRDERGRATGVTGGARGASPVQ